MGKAKKLKAIKRLAVHTPLVNEHTHEVHLLKGSEILSWGTVKEIEGKPIDPDRTYRFNMPVMIIQNNARRLKRAWQRGGVKGISNYLASVKNVIAENFING